MAIAINRMGNAKNDTNSAFYILIITHFGQMVQIELYKKNPFQPILKKYSIGENLKFNSNKRTDPYWLSEYI